MRTLLAFEFKKLLNRRIVWVALVLSAALLALNSYPAIKLAMDGSVDGMREVYARYEGQTLTDALHDRMLSDYQQYAAAHPDDFRATSVQGSPDDLGYWAQNRHRRTFGMSFGMSMAYLNLMNIQTVETLQTEWQQAKEALQTGVTAEGVALGGNDRHGYEVLTSRPPAVPIVHYDLGWTDNSNTYLIDMMMGVTGVGLSDMVLFGIVLPLAVLLMGLALWDSERRMEPVVLTGARRRSALLAKALAAMLAAAAMAVALCIWELGLRVVPFGVQGWNVVPAAYSTTHLYDWAVSTLLVVLCSAACAALIALVSAAVRGGLAGLALSALTLAAQFFLWKLCYALYVNWLFSNMNSNARFTKPHWAYLTDAVTQVLPLYRINIHAAGNLSATTPRGGMLALALTVAVGLCALGLWLMPKVYLRKRKA